MAFPPHQTHVEERGLAMPAETRETRRPRKRRDLTVGDI
jgi:hypothetical protein